MKALIIFRERDCGWLREFYPGHHPAMVTICNKPLLEFKLDFAMLCGCSEVRIVVDESGPDIETYFAGGERWGLDISYSLIKSHESIDSLLLKNSTFCHAVPLLLIDGFLFIHYDKAKGCDPLAGIETGLLSSCASGTVLVTEDIRCMKSISDGSLAQNFALSPLTCLDDLFQISLQVLEAEQAHYVLPGYGTDRGILLGQNVEISRNAAIVPPVIIGDNVRLLGNAQIGPSVVIGSNVIIDSGTQVERCIVQEGSYLGRELFLSERIISGDRVISPRDGAILDIEDGCLLSPITPQTPGYCGRVVNILLAMILAAVWVVPYYLLAGLQKIQNDWHIEYRNFLLTERGDCLTLPVVRNNQHSPAGKLFSALGLATFPLLAAVMCGKLLLVGNRLLADHQANRELLRAFPEYLPGAFAYSDSEDVLSGSMEEEIAERYHAANRGLGHDMRILQKIIWLHTSAHRFNR
jgi:NDP-sugar pyrophosphorylase family protein